MPRSGARVRDATARIIAPMRSFVLRMVVLPAPVEVQGTRHDETPNGGLFLRRIEETCGKKGTNDPTLRPSRARGPARRRGARARTRGIGTPKRPAKDRARRSSRALRLRSR